MNSSVGSGLCSTSYKHVEYFSKKNCLTWWYVFKTSLRCLQDIFARRLGKTSWRCLEDALKMSWKRLEDVLKTSWKRLEDVLKTYGQDEYIGLDQDVLKTSSEDVWLIRIYSSSSRRLEDVFWRRRRKTSLSRRMFAGLLVRLFDNDLGYVPSRHRT